MYIFSCLLVVHTHTKAVFNPQAALHPMGVIAAFNIAKRMPNRLSGLPSRGFGDSGTRGRRRGLNTALVWVVGWKSGLRTWLGV